MNLNVYLFGNNHFTNGVLSGFQFFWQLLFYHSWMRLCLHWNFSPYCLSLLSSHYWSSWPPLLWCKSFYVNSSANQQLLHNLTTIAGYLPRLIGNSVPFCKFSIAKLMVITVGLDFSYQCLFVPAHWLSVTSVVLLLLSWNCPCLRILVHSFSCSCLRFIGHCQSVCIPAP